MLCSFIIKLPWPLQHYWYTVFSSHYTHCKDYALHDINGFQDLVALVIHIVLYFLMAGKRVQTLRLCKCFFQSKHDNNYQHLDDSFGWSQWPSNGPIDAKLQKNAIVVKYPTVLYVAPDIRQDQWEHHLILATSPRVVYHSISAHMLN